MKTVLRQWPFILLAAAVFTLLSGCVATTGGYGGEDYYEPSGYYYNGWGPTYRVGPPRRGDHDDHPGPPHAESHQGHPAYRPAPPSRAVPSIPTKPRPQPRGPGEHKK